MPALCPARTPEPLAVERACLRRISVATMRAYGVPRTHAGARTPVRCAAPLLAAQDRTPGHDARGPLGPARTADGGAAWSVCVGLGGAGRRCGRPVWC